MTNHDTSASKFHLKSNVWHALFAFVANTILAFWSYRLIIDAGGLALVGLWAMLQAWLQVARVGDFGIGGAAAKFLGALDPDASTKDRRAIIDTAIVSNAAIFAVLSAIGFIALDALGPAIIPSGGTPAEVQMARATVPVLFLAFFLQGLVQPLLGSLQGLYKGYLGARISVAGVIVQLCLAIWLIPRLALVGFAWAQVGQNLFVVASAWMMIVYATSDKGFHPVPKWGSLDKAFEIVRFSIRLQAVSLANGFFEPACRFVIGYFGGLVGLGTFELAYRTLQTPRSAIYMTVQSTLPAIAHLVTNDLGQARDLYRRILRYVLAGLAAVGALAIVVAPIISLAILGHIDMNYLATVAILAPGIGANALASPAHYLGVAIGSLRLNFTSALIALGGIVLLPWPLLLMFGPYGPVIAASVSLLFGGAYLKITVERRVLNGR